MSYDRIHLRSLRVDALVGVDGWERVKEQPHIISITIPYDNAGSVAAVGDNLSSYHTASYSTVLHTLRDFVKRRSFRTLEAFALATAVEVFTKCGVRELKQQDDGLTVRVEQPKALLLADGYRIEITRNRAQLEGLASLYQRYQEQQALEPVQQPLDLYDFSAGPDSVFVNHLTLRTTIGINPWERLQEQKLNLDITIYLDLDASTMLLDRIQNSFNFRIMATSITDYVEKTSFKTIEVLIENVAEILLNECGAPKVMVQIMKPSAVVFAETAGLEIVRTRKQQNIVKARDMVRHVAFLGLESFNGYLSVAFPKLHTTADEHRSICRIQSISNALDSICRISSNIKLDDTSFLYQANIKGSQSKTLNVACKISTSLNPLDLLITIGQTTRESTGLKIHILLFDAMEFKSDAFEVPHPDLHCNQSLLRPLCELSASILLYTFLTVGCSIAGKLMHPSLVRTFSKLLNIITHHENYDPELVRMHQVTPIGRQLVNLYLPTQTLVMGILNISESTDETISKAQALIRNGANVITLVDSDEDPTRITSVMKAIRAISNVSDETFISVETLSGKIPKQAVLANVDLSIITSNTVDEGTITNLVEAKVPVCIRHEELGADMASVRNSLLKHVEKLISRGVCRWNIIIDPGIGSEKSIKENLSLLRNLSELSALGSSLERFPVLVGQSRRETKDSIWNTSVACSASVMGGASINLRVDCLVGVDAWERPKHQPLVISVVVACDIAGSVKSVGDNLSSKHTVSYSEVLHTVRNFVAKNSYRTLEALAMAIAHEIFVKSGVRNLKQEAGLTVKIEKPKALLFANYVGIEITRTRTELEELHQLLEAKKLGPVTPRPPQLEPYDHTVGNDTIYIRQLALSAIIGINPWERLNKQRLFFDITIHLHLISSFIIVDRIPDQFNFRIMVKKISDYVEGTFFKTLEALIESVSDILLNDCGAPKVWIRISKPSAVAFADTAGVEITRERKLGKRGDESPRKRMKMGEDGEPIEHIAYLGLGSNLGDRAKNIAFGIDSFCKDSTKLLDTSFLYETKPMYVTDQPNFLNAACKVSTTLSPTELLKKIKEIEAAAGRDFTVIRNGPRPLDMDILFYDTLELKSEVLEIPHKLLHEREFVLRPLCDIAPSLPHPTRFQTCAKLLSLLVHTEGYDLESHKMHQVTPFPTRADSAVWAWSSHTRIMGILNVTPDSFSDGGKFVGVDAAVSQARLMVENGADVVDVGGQSTRPGADIVEEEVEMGRVVPVIKSLRENLKEGVLISVDTFRAEVARQAVLAGADFINDVSGGEFDEKMISVMAEMKVPVCIMHMRGDPKTMQSMTKYENDDVVTEVRNVLTKHVSKLISNGVYRWNIIIDPGIGFAKTGDQNFTLLRKLDQITAPGTPLARFPVLVGPSRKGFLKAGATNKDDPKERVWATAAACSASVMGGAGIIRVHDVKEMKDVIATSDVLYRSKQ
ncbi:UNVERIFIED_CONTAM: trifunctional dihydropteroate synthetase [Siphonaria sp. JEL0065]|nr:trifunctional dihydropteroate synthetase [Siphonaria sp. JEL0065]